MPKPKANIRDRIITRTALIYMLMFVFVIYLFVKLIQIMFFEKEEWYSKISKIAIDLRENMPERGNIYDENGNVLATSVSYFDIHMDMKAGGLTDRIFNENIDSLSFCLSNYFKNKSKEQYKSSLIKARKKSDRFYKIAEKLTYDEYAEIRKFPLFRLPSNKGGFMSQKTTLRKRPFEGLLRRTIGFMGEDKETGLVQGKAGLEYTYNRDLGGRAGKQYMQKIGGGNWREIKGGKLLDTEPGLDVITSINIDLQDFVDDVLKDQMINLRADYGSVVVMEVETGLIKAIANLKRYDDDSFSEVLNYAVGENLAPGSTFKLPVLMAVLEDGYVDLDDIIETGNGHIIYHGVSVDDVEADGYGSIPVWKVFAKSSNVGMLKIIDDNYVKKGRIDRFLKQLSSIGIGDISGVDIFGEHKPFIKTPDHYLWATSTPGMIAHGYEVNISPLQLLTFYNAVANNGVMMKPRIVKRLEKNGMIVKEYKPEVTNSLICSKSTILKAQKILRDVVVEGTAAGINTDKYKISGKTGTTQYYDFEQKMHIDKYRASFIGYFPSDKPKYSIIVVINKPQKDYYGSQAAAPVFKRISDKIFSYDREINPPKETIIAEDTKIPYSKNGSKDDLTKILSSVLIPIQNNAQSNQWVNTEAQKKMVLFSKAEISKHSIPDLKFMGAKDAVFLLESMGVESIINGRGFVVYQSINPGTAITKGMKIVLDLK